jgi:hypothetical protein
MPDASASAVRSSWSHTAIFRAATIHATRAIETAAASDLALRLERRLQVASGASRLWRHHCLRHPAVEPQLRVSPATAAKVAAALP